MYKNVASAEFASSQMQCNIESSGTLNGCNKLERFSRHHETLFLFCVYKIRAAVWPV